jgi:hypothetical protein
MWTINDFPPYGMLSGWTYAWETSMSILHGKQQGIHANKQKQSFFFLLSPLFLAT